VGEMATFRISKKKTATITGQTVYVDAGHNITV
jgi:enoyl-[acyl-carrier-protein] reductase (NADH)